MTSIINKNITSKNDESIDSNLELVNTNIVEN